LFIIRRSVQAAYSPTRYDWYCINRIVSATRLFIKVHGEIVYKLLVQKSSWWRTVTCSKHVEDNLIEFIVTTRSVHLVGLAHVSLLILCPQSPKLPTQTLRKAVKHVTVLKVTNLLAPELFCLILAHPVYKMWIIQEPNTLELWNKLHFEEKKNWEYIPCFKYSVPIFVE